MTARFMSDTPYAGTEQEMQRIPGFHSRGTGIAVSHFRYSAKDCDCRLCAYKSRKRKCEKADGCICLRERLVAGCVPFQELLERLTAEVTVSPFVSRVAHLSMQSHPCFFLAGHRERFEPLWERHIRTAEEDAMCAALYLLSADRFLWGKAISAIEPDIIHFQKIHIHGVDLNGYVLFHTAKDLYQGTKHISLSELVDPELVGDMTFELIITAFLIRRYGCGVLSAERSKRC